MAESLPEILGKVGGTQRVAAILVGIGALAVVWGFSHWGMEPTYVPVATGLPLKRIGEATQRLDEAGITYRLDRGGSVISVEQNAAGKARVVLAADGLTGSTDRPGFELFDQPSWGMTDFTQRVNYRRALEGELERTIGRMRGVDGAEVHLTLQESSYLSDSQESSEASVVLQRSPSAITDEAMVEGIQSLVASSVEGLVPDKVTVLDDRGRLLSSSEANGIGLSNRQLQVQRQVETYLKSKAEALVQQMVGPGNASVRVSAQLNFDQLDRTTHGVNPDQQALVSEDKAEITPAQKDQGAGSVTTNTVYQNTQSTETLSRGGAHLERLTVAVVLNDKETKATDGTVTYQARSPSEVKQVEAVVRNAVGFSQERGDQISVVSAPTPPKPPAPAADPGPSIAGMLITYQRPIVAIVGLIVALLLMSKVLGTLKSGTPSAERSRAEALASAPRDVDLGAPQPAPALPAATAPARTASRPEVSDPAMTARVVRAWMKES